MIYKTKDDFKNLLNDVTELEAGNLYEALKELGFIDPKTVKWKRKYKTLRNSLITTLKNV